MTGSKRNNKKENLGKKSYEEKSKKKSIYRLCFDAQDKYSKIYGEKTIVFLQVGKFYEAYCTETEGYINLVELEKLLDIQYIRRSHLRIENSNYRKPDQFGIHCVSIKKNLTMMVENGYTIILFDQVNNGDGIERKYVGTFSPGTFISDIQLDDYIYNLCVYIVEEKQLVGQKTLMAIGLTLIDITTGLSVIHEFYSNKLDERFGLDELVRIMQTYRPIETIIYYQPDTLDDSIIKNIKLYLELDKFKNLHFYIYHNKKGNDRLDLLTEEMFKINYQNEYLSNIFDLKLTQQSLNRKQCAIEFLGLENKTYVTVSLMIILKYISEHNINLLKNLSYPEVYLYNKHLILGNNAIEQLNILDSGILETYNRKIKSLFDVINKTSTPMGKRFLKENLLNPLSQENKKVISDRYNIIDELAKNKLYKEIREILKNIYDMEKLHRKMAMGIIVPAEFYKLDIFYQATTKIISRLREASLSDNIISETVVKDFLKYQYEYSKEYDLEKTQKYRDFSDIDFSFFKKGIDIKIDKIQGKIDYVWSIIDATNNYFTNLITSKNARRNNKEILVADSNDRDGYYFTVNKTNEKILKEQIAKKKNPIKIDLSIGDTLNINKEDIKFKQLPKGRTKIFIASLVEHTIDLSKQKIELSKLIKKIFIKSMSDYYSKYKKMLHTISKFVAEIDFLVSGATVANLYYYCKPKISLSESPSSYLKAKDLRHAIIERLTDETEYVPNDIELGNVPMKLISKAKRNVTGKNIEHENSELIEDTGDIIEKNGMVVFSINGSGKCLKNDTPVIMFNGRVKKAEDIKKGDMLMGDDSTPRNVLGTCKGKGLMYKIIPERGDPYTVNGPHILCLKSSASVALDKGKIIHISVDDYLKKPIHWRKYYYTYHVSIDFPEQTTDINPYIIGHWLGGNEARDIQCGWPEIQSGWPERNLLQSILEKHDLINNKHIPYEYLYNSRKNRMKLLAGLIDSAGSNHHSNHCDNGISINQKNEKVSDDIVYLAISLGFFCEKQRHIETIHAGNDECDKQENEIYFRIHIFGDDFSELASLLKHEDLLPCLKYQKNYFRMCPFTIEEMGMGDYCGFELDGNHRFLLKDCTVTHNSSLMKSIGIAIILAQIGYYVPASEFIYEPYMALYARITGNDNIFKGLSSFALEMTELDSILSRVESQGPKTLVIGDEVCRGTEDISGRAIVASALVTLSECKCSFIFSSHLHDIQYIEEVKQLKNLRMCHLRVEYDEDNDCLIYDRKLSPGSGPSVYGLMVAKYLIKNKKFVNRAEIIKKRIMAEDQNTIPTKRSKYNKDLLVINCLVCGYKPTSDTDKDLESHHIHFQRDCWTDGKIKEKPYLNKNRLSNLVILCRKCHNRVHRGEISIKGYADTSIGPLLDYNFNTEKKIKQSLIQLNKLSP